MASPDRESSEPIRTEQVASSPVLAPVVNKVEPESRGTLQLAPPQASPDTPEPAAQSDSEADNAPIHIELSAVQRTWLSISSDGKTTYTGVLGVSQTKVLESKETATIRTANAGGVNIVFNGRSLGPLRPAWTIPHLRLHKRGYEVVRRASK